MTTEYIKTYIHNYNLLIEYLNRVTALFAANVSKYVGIVPNKDALNKEFIILNNKEKPSYIQNFHCAVYSDYNALRLFFEWSPERKDMTSPYISIPIDIMLANNEKYIIEAICPPYKKIIDVNEVLKDYEKSEFLKRELISINDKYSNPIASKFFLKHV